MGVKAAQALERMQKAGGWVLLQNSHLAGPWLQSLSQILRVFAGPTPAARGTRAQVKAEEKRMRDIIWGRTV